MLLPDLRIRNYRLFKEFEIDRLARVNLIAGKNNTGKSSLLEAAYLVANPDVPSALADVLEVRGESDRRSRRSIVFPLFYGYRLSLGSTVGISSGGMNVSFLIPDQDEARKLLDELYRSSRMVRSDEEIEPEEEEPVLLMQIKRSGGKSWSFLLRGEEGVTTPYYLLRRPLPLGQQEPKCAFLLEGTASLYSRFREMAKKWDGISLTPQAGDVIEALRIIELRVKNIDFLGTEDNVKVLLEGEESPILIGSLGDGMRHLLMIALLLVSARGGVLLIDEMDTGLHYTVMVDLWRLVFKMAEKLDVQVLATTHSLDCITAFSEAWSEAKESDGLYLRLRRKGEQIRTVIYTAEELRIAIEQGIEVR